MELDLTVPQAEYHQSTAKATCAVAGFGSGKTNGTMYRMMSSAIQWPKCDWLYTAPTVPLIRDILWAKLEEFLPEIGMGYTINKQENIVYLHGHGKIFCRSMDSPDRIVGFEVMDAFMDELDILPMEKALNVYRKVKARCRQKAPHDNPKRNQQWVTTTPEGFKATYELFKKNPAADSHLVQMTTYSNAHNLPDDYIADLRDTYPEQLIDAYLLGEFVNLVAKPVWSGYDPRSNHAMNVEIQPGETLHIGQDFNVGRGCAVVYIQRNIPPNHPAHPLYLSTKKKLRHLNQPHTIFIAKGEIFNSFDTPDTARALNELYPKSMFPERYLYPDATGRSRKSVNATLSDISLMRSAGFIIRKNTKNPAIKDRVTAANGAFCNAQHIRKTYVDKEACPNFSNALVQQVYDDNGLPKKGENEHDDMTDAGTYPIAWHFPVKRSRMYVDEARGL